MTYKIVFYIYLIQYPRMENSFIQTRTTSLKLFRNLTNQMKYVTIQIEHPDKDKQDRVRTEIGNQNSRTFPGLFKDYLHFFQESFFIDGNSPNTAYTQDFCPIQDRKRISLSGSLFLPDFSSAYCLCTLLLFLTFPISAL